MLMKSNIYKSAAQVTIFSTIEKMLSFVYRIILSRSIGAEGLAYIRYAYRFLRYF